MEHSCFFSILVVCLNPGDKLKPTLDSIRAQSCKDYEVLIKDGGSTDGTLETLHQIQMESNESVRVIEQPDQGIYDAMNQATRESSGRFLYFLNCGDTFSDSEVLSQMKQVAESTDGQDSYIFYGNIFERKTGQVVASNPKIDAFGCYRNVPCHQACFYQRELVLQHAFQTQYKVRADYEQFLWCFFKAKARTVFTGIEIADYEGGGFSETTENRKLSAKEHEEITGNYMSPGQLVWFRLVMLLTLAPLRTAIAENQKTAAIYNRIKKCLYRS